LQDYRTKLEGIRGSATNTIDTLIRISKELAEVQSETEGLSGKRAKLIERVQTETLTVEIGANQSPSSWKPITAALAEFGDNLSRAAATAITAIAYLIPWLIVLIALVWIIRWLWSRRKRSVMR
jgi:hypothetical protein